MSRPNLRPIDAGDQAPRPKGRAPWERIGLPSRADAMASDMYPLREFSIGDLFALFLGCQGEDGDPIESGMLNLARELDALTQAATMAVRDAGADVCPSDSTVPTGLAVCAARARVLAELHRRALEASESPEASDG